MTSPSWQIELMERHPRIFKVVSMSGHAVRVGFPAVQDGWRQLVEIAAARISAVAPLEGLWIERISEKWGRLQLVVQRVGWIDPVVIADVAAAVDLAEARSACSCQVCGDDGYLHCDDGWFATLCTRHAKGAPVVVAPENLNLEVVRTYVCGELRISSARRYDREGDRFVEVDPDSIGVEHEA